MRNRPWAGERGSLLVLLGLGWLVALGCTGEHKGSREDDLIPALDCTFPPAMTAEIPQARYVDAIAVHGDQVYLSMRGRGIWQVPKAGGALVESPGPPVPLSPRSQPTETSDDSYVYRLDYSQGEIVRLKKDGSTRTALASVATSSASFTLVLFGQSLYWTSSTGSLHRVPKGGGAPATTIASFGTYEDRDFRGLLAVDLDAAYYLAGPTGAPRARGDDPLWLVRACR